MKFTEKLRIIIEGKIIESRLKPDEADNRKPPEELYQRIVEELKQKGIYREDESED